MTKLVIALVLAAGIAACDRGETYDAHGTVIDTVNTDTTARLNLPDIDIGTTTDTLTVPTFSTQKDTVIVDKPVRSGSKQVEVKRPTVDVNRKP